MTSNFITTNLTGRRRFSRQTRPQSRSRGTEQRYIDSLRHTYVVKREQIRHRYAMKSSSIEQLPQLKNKTRVIDKFLGLNV